jgi:DNA-binding beta-propeller fold protein YncE
VSVQAAAARGVRAALIFGRVAALFAALSDLFLVQKAFQKPRPMKFIHRGHPSNFRRRLAFSKPCALLIAGLLSTCFVEASPRIVLVAGGSQDAVNIPAKSAKLKEPFGTDFDAAGNMWIVEMASGNRLLKVDASGMLTHVAGQSQPGFSGDGGPALEAKFNGPHNLAVLPEGNILIADTWNGKVREVDLKSGRVDSVAGYEVAAQMARGNGPYCITLDFSGTRLYISDLRSVHVLDLLTHKLSLLAGNGTKGVPVDGSVAVDSPLVDPRAVAPDRLGNVYILERGGNALRVVNKEGRIRTVVNASGKPGGTGDGGAALEALLNGPKHLCVDRDNSVIIADAESNLVRRYVPETGRIERVAGTGQKSGEGLDGAPEKCGLARPHGVVVHPQTGELYITDSYNNRVLKIIRE